MCLLGKLWYAHKENNKAVDCYVEALRLNPFMWDAFMGLCETGELRSRGREIAMADLNSKVSTSVFLTSTN